jgi:hypothetical protein
MKNLKTYKNNSMTIFTSSTRALRRCTPSLSVIPSISAISSIRYCSSHASDQKPADTLGDNTKLFRITLPEDDASPEAVDAVVLQIDHLILAACKLRVCPPEMLKIAPTIICGRAVGKTIDLAPLKLSEFVSQAPSDIKARLGKISKFVLDVILDA